MKKLLTLLLAMLMTFAFTAVAFAEEAAAPPAAKDEFAAEKAEIKVLKNELLTLRAQHQAIHTQAVEKRGTLKTLIKAAKEASLTEKLEAAKAFNEHLKAVTAEIKIIREDKEALWVQLKAAKTQKDYEAVKTNLTQIIGYKKQIVEKATARLGVMDQSISSLQ